MTEVVFHFGAADKLDYARRLLRKAAAKGVRTLVQASTSMSAGLDRALWEVPATSFLTHCDRDAPESVARRSVVMFDGAGHGPSDSPGTPDVLVNLRPGLPAEPQRYQRIIEIVSVEPDDRQAARARWKQYTALGYAITSHDLSAAKENH